MNITFVISSLSFGGAEKVSTMLCNFWSQKNNNVNIVILNKNDDVNQFKVSKKIKVHRLENNSNFFFLTSIFSNLKKIFYLIKFFKKTKTDIVVSFMTENNILSIIGSKILGIPIVISERTVPGVHKINFFWKILRLMTYRFSDAIVVQSKFVSHWFEKKFKLQTYIISNPVFKKKKNNNIKPKKLIITIGRLSEEKGHEILIRAFAKIEHLIHEWSLYIYGKGILETKLKRLILDLDLNKKIKIKGVSVDNYSSINECQIYAHTSFYEGFSNTILEALSLNKCVLATDCPGANKEFLEKNKFALMCRTGDVDSVSKQLLKLVKNKNLRKYFEKKSSRALKGLDVESIGEQWLAIFNKLFLDFNNKKN